MSMGEPPRRSGGARLTKVAAVTRLAAADRHVVEILEAAGVTVLVHYAPDSTCVKLDYPTQDVDVRDMYVTAFAGPIGLEQVESVDARAAVLGTSIRGEVGLEVIQSLRRRGMLARICRGSSAPCGHAPNTHPGLRRCGAAALDIVKGCGWAEF
jgi:hypothetical protein